MARGYEGSTHREDMIKEVVEVQTESGSKIMTSICYPVFIFASFWPSWGFAAKASGCHNMFSCLKDVGKGVERLLANILLPRERCLQENEWKAELKNILLRGKEKKVVVLLQVSKDIVEELLQWMKDVVHGMHGATELICGWCVVEDAMKLAGDNRGTSRCEVGNLVGGMTSSEIKISHAQVGGVFNHEWTFGFNRLLTEDEIEAARRPSEVRAVLGDLLSTTIAGRHCRAPAGGKSTGSLQWRERHGWVTARCVFSPTGWTERPMSADEVMDVYDIKRKDRDAMLEIWGRERETWPFPFMRQIPVRVLERCFEVLILPSIVRRMIKRPNPGERTLDPDLKRTKDNLSVGEGVERMEEELMRGTKESFNKPPGGIKKAIDAKLEAKNDDAQARVEEWDRRACQHLQGSGDWAQQQRACDLLRRAMLRRYRHYKYGIIRSFRLYMNRKHGEEWLVTLRREMKKRRGQKEIGRDYDVGMDSIRRALRASFWEWEDGSTIFFWRWPSALQTELRDGMRVWYKKRDLPTYWGRQRWPKDTRERDQLKDKIGKVLSRRYITEGYVSSLTGFFAVPKGVDDIRVVYDATKSGLNDAIWAPNFFLPTINSVVAKADDRTFFGDIDIGEMFLNYFLDPRLRPKAGVDVTELAEKFGVVLKPEQRWILRWERSLMGVRSSPFNCVRIYLLGEEVIRGDRHATNNPFRWDHVVLNLPGSKNYNPSMPWLMLYDSKSRRLAAFVVSYVDDLRTGSQGKESDGDRVVHHVACKLNYLGQQDAARKRGFASKTPGAWAGAVVEAELGDGIYVTISQDKWDKVKRIVQRYEDAGKSLSKENQVWLDRKELERDVGFLVHVFMTYENLRPFLKGFYLTLNG
jgi:hypothetical protein